ncbi:MAG: DUF1566 domain-containing protein [Oligoflexales bacterium]
MQSLLTFIVFLFALVGCYGGPGFLKQSGTAQPMAVSATTSSTGVVSASVDPNSKLTQVVQAPLEEGDTAVSFPPGALNVGTDILVQSGSNIATPSLADDLDIDGFSSAGGAVVVSSSTAVDATNPFTISLPIPGGASLALADPYEFLVVVYKITKVGESQTTAGIIPREEIVIANGKLEFQTMYFGVFQPSFTQTIVEAPVEVVTTEPIQTKIEEKTLPPIEILGRQPFVIQAGKTIEITGLNFRPTMTLALGGTEINKLKLVSDSKASFVAPANLKSGVVTLAIAQEGTSQNASLIYSPASDKPVISLAPEKVCSDVEFYDMTGVLRKGTKTCASTTAPTCTTDGQIGCITTAAIPAVVKANIPAADIRSGATIVGVAGSLANCAGDGATGCVANTNYKAAKMTNFDDSKILIGTTIAGVSGGAIVETHSNCSSDGEVGCTTTTAYKAADMDIATAGNIKSTITIAGQLGNFTGLFNNCGAYGQDGCVATPTYPTRPADCATDGDVGCVAAGNFKAIDSTNLPLASLRDNASILSQPGTITSCSADGASDCYATGIYNAADTVNNAIPANIKSGTNVAGIPGSIPPPPGNCGVDGDSGCFVDGSTYKAAAVTSLLAANIRVGSQIGGMPGAYPSPSAPLAGSDSTDDLPNLASTVGGTSYEWFTSDGTRMSGTIQVDQTVTPNTANQTLNAGLYRSVTVQGDPDLIPTNIKNGVFMFGLPSGQFPSGSSPLVGDSSGTSNDLDGPNFDAQIKVGGQTYEFWNSVGAKFTVNGNGSIVSANIKSGISIFGTTGTHGPPCGTDGNTGCVVNPPFKAANTTGISVYDVRKGKTIAGFVGELALNKNMAGTYNNTAGPATSSPQDMWDTIDDYNGGGASTIANLVPTTTGWFQPTGTNWIRHGATDTVIGGTCDLGEECIFIDQITGLHFFREDPLTTYDYDAAGTFCNDLTGYFDDWRVPTQKELMQAYVDGAYFLKSANKMDLATTNVVWSSTTDSQQSGYAYVVGLGKGVTQTTPKGGSYKIFCVRP